MSGKLIGSLIVITALVAGIAIYYLQVYAFYEQLPSEEVEIRLTGLVTGAPEPILIGDVEAIDSDSSPLRFRACFTTASSIAALSEEFHIYDAAEPLNAPDWFSCFDAAAVGVALKSGDAVAFLGERNIHDGVDRVVAVFEDGRAYAWHQLNEAYD